MVLCLGLGHAATGYASVGPPAFEAPATIDGQSTGFPVAGISCADGPGAALCVAVSSGTSLAVLANPDSSAPQWTTATVPGDDTTDFTGVSCPSTSLCVAVNGDQAFVSTNPTAATPTWTPISIPQASLHLGFGRFVLGVSCTSLGVCAVWSRFGTAFVASGVGGGGTVTWTQVSGGFLTGSISCTDGGGCVGTAQGGGGSVASVTGASTPSPSWSSAVSIDPKQALTGISCVAGQACVAVDGAGEAVISTNDTGAAWGAPVVIEAGNGLSGVSCATGSATCVAVNSSGTGATVAFSFDAASGLAQASAPQPLGGPGPGELVGPQGLLVSCAAGGLCVVALAGQGETQTSTDLESATPPTWSPLTFFDGTTALSGVSCAPGGPCAAVDRQGDAALAPTASGGDPVWSAAASVDPGHALTGVSCTGTGLCVAVDNAGRAVVATDSGGATPTWSAPFSIDAHGLSGVSCASVTLCVAVDDAGGAVSSATPAEAGSGSWSATPGIDGTVSLTGVSCPSAGLCVAVDSDGQAVISTTGASSWSPAASIDPSGPLSAVSCNTGGLCVAVDQSGQAVSSTNAATSTPTWSTTPLTIDAGHVLSSVSCTTDGFCLAGDTAGGAVFTNAAGATSPGWTPVSPLANPGPVSGASCTDGGLCVLVDSLDGLELTGHRTAAAVSFSGASGTFADTPVGSTSAPETVTITDSGGGALNISSVAVAGAEPSQFALSQNTCVTPLTLQPGKSCTVDVAFVPTSPTTLSAALQVTSDAPSSPESLGLSGVGTQAALTLSPASGSFPDTPVGSMSAAQPIEVSDSGNGTLDISGITLTGSDAAQFAVTGNSCETTLAPTTHCFVDVAFAPQSTGTYSAAALQVATDAPSGPESVGLSGIGGTPAVSVPASASFGDTTVGTTSASQSVTLTNSGTATLHIANVALAGADAGQFTLAASGCAAQALAPDATCSVSVAFSPTSAGPHTSASLSIQSDAPSSPDTVALSGTGLTAAPAAPQPAAQPQPAPQPQPVTDTLPSNAFTLVAVRAAGQGAIVITLKLADAGSLAVKTTTKIPKAKPKIKSLAGKKATASKVAATTAITYGSLVSRKATGPATLSLTIRPGKTAAAGLKGHGKLRVAITIEFTPMHGKPRTKSVGVTVKSAARP